MLSGGQKQRIVRAILKNSPIVILDEPTNSLYAQSETMVQKVLDELMKSKVRFYSMWQAQQRVKEWHKE